MTLDDDLDGNGGIPSEYLLVKDGITGLLICVLLTNIGTRK